MCCWALFSLFNLGTELELDVGGCVRLLEAAAAAAALAGRDKLGGKEFWAVSEKSPRCMFGPHTSPVSATERETQSVVLGFSITQFYSSFLIKKNFPLPKIQRRKKNNLVSHSQFFIILFLFFEFSQELFFPPSVWKMLFVLIFTSGLLLVVTFCSLRWPHVLWRRERPEAKIIFRSHSHTICESLSIFLVSFWRKEKKKCYFVAADHCIMCFFMTFTGRTVRWWRLWG